MGDAIRKVLKEIFTEEGSFKDILLITDGEDQESMPLKAAEEAGVGRSKAYRLGTG